MRAVSLLSHTLTALAAFAIASAAYGVVYTYTQQVTGTPPNPVTSDNPLPVSSLLGAVSLNGGSGIVFNAPATVTLNPVTNKTLYLTGFDCRSAGAAANTMVDIQLSGITSASGALHFPFTSGSAGQGSVAATGNAIIVMFPVQIPAASPTTAITLTMPGVGTGDLGSACHLYGYAK